LESSNAFFSIKTLLKLLLDFENGFEDFLSTFAHFQHFFISHSLKNFSAESFHQNSWNHSLSRNKKRCFLSLLAKFRLSKTFQQNFYVLSLQETSVDF
jgi:hypothetical protein